MVHALYERAIAPDLLIGTSAGALNAAFLASRPATTATAQELAALWRGLRRRDILPLRPATLLGGLAGRRDHLIPDAALRRLAARHLQFQRLEQAAIPLHWSPSTCWPEPRCACPTAPPSTRWSAPRPSPACCRPSAGAAGSSPTAGSPTTPPLWHAVALGARRIYVLPTANPGDRGLPHLPRAALAAAVHAVTVLTNARLHGDLARYAHSAELIMLPAANPGHIPPTDFGHAGQLITRALAATRMALAAGTPNPPAAAVTLAGLWLAGPGSPASPASTPSMPRSPGFRGHGWARCLPRWRPRRSATTSPTGPSTPPRAAIS
jgi:NTE family protein